MNRAQAEALRAGQSKALALLCAGNPLSVVLESLVRFMEEQVPEALCSILFKSRDGTHYRLRAGPNVSGDTRRGIEAFRATACMGPCSAAYHGEPILVEDLASNPLCHEARTLPLQYGLRSCWSRPILSSRGQTLGTVAIYRPTHDRPNGIEGDLIDMVACIAGIAIERQHMQETLRLSNQARDRLLREREALIQNLHDGVLQSIYAVTLALQECRRLVQAGSSKAVKRLNGAITDLNRILREAREYLAGNPLEINNGAQLKAALERMVRAMGAASGVRTKAIIDSDAADVLAPEQARHVYYITQEAMSNSLRHARCRASTVSLRMRNGAVRLEIRDDGVGFQVDANHSKGRGLANLSARARALGTQMLLSSSPGRGTRVVVEIHRRRKDATEEGQTYSIADCR